MTMFLAPYTAIADIDGSPLDAGFLFFGEYGKDPELFPVEVFWDADFTVPAAQPIRTRNGYPVRNGSPTKVYLKTAQHSIVIKNRNSAFILVDFENKGWSADFVVDGDKTQKQINDITTQNIPSISSLRLFKPRKDGQVVNVLSHRAGFNLGGGLFKWDAFNTLPDNSFDVIKVTSIETGRFIRIKKSNIAMIEEAGGFNGEDVTDAVNILLAAGVKTITGVDGASYIFNNVVLSRGVVFKGDFEITKIDKFGRMFSLYTGDYTIEWDGITFDGKYAGDGIEGDEDIVIAQAVDDGLVINFKKCKNNNISKKLFSSGYNAVGKLKQVNIVDCGGNGRHRHRSNSEQYYIYDLHYTEINIIRYNEVGDGIFSESGGIVTRMPMSVLYATFSKVTIDSPVLKDAGGFSLYKACDDATMIRPQMDNTAYPFRVQQAKNTRIIGGGSITNCPFTGGAIIWQPYARINTALARKEEGLTGFLIDDNLIFSGNKNDIGIIGDHVYSGLHGVADCRARGVVIKAIFEGAESTFGVLQDADCDFSGSTFKVSSTQTQAFRFVQTAANGAGKLSLGDTRWDGTLKTSDFQILLNSSILTGSQSETEIHLKGSRLHNMTATSQYLIYFRGAGEVNISDNTWTGLKPKLLALIRDNDNVIVRGNKGYTYPMNATNGGSVVFSSETLPKYLDIDVARESTSPPSNLFTTNANIPAYTTLAIGSTAKISNPIAGGSAEYIYTAAGWKLSSTIQS
jgi:hypothetical protein